MRRAAASRDASEGWSAVSREDRGAESSRADAMWLPANGAVSDEVRCIADRQKKTADHLIRRNRIQTLVVETSVKLFTTRFESSCHSARPFAQSAPARSPFSAASLPPKPYKPARVLFQWRPQPRLPARSPWMGS